MTRIFYRLQMLIHETKWITVKEFDDFEAARSWIVGVRKRAPNYVFRLAKITEETVPVAED